MPALPTLLIHGYSAESAGISPGQIAETYGTLPAELRQRLGSAPSIINLSRYISLDDGITLDDLARALHTALLTEQSALMRSAASFNIVTHSTGALVARAWLLRHSPRPSPCARIVHLAGAIFGSGWAHIGKGQLTRWARGLFTAAGESGIKVLSALELGSQRTIDLHLALGSTGNRLWADLGVREACIIGSQADRAWMPVPIRYIKEDGADGVLRVSAANSNFIHAKITPTAKGKAAAFDDALAHTHSGPPGDEFAALAPVDDEADGTALYRINFDLPGSETRPLVPLAIPYETAHGGEKRGIVSGSQNREEVMPLLVDALTAGTTDAAWAQLAKRFDRATEVTRRRAAQTLAPGLVEVFDPRAQYDEHCMLTCRLRDQEGNPIEHFDIFFDSPGSLADPATSSAVPPGTIPINSLFEDHHVPREKGMINFYLRLTSFHAETGEYVDLREELAETVLRICASEPGTSRITYLPIAVRLSAAAVAKLLQPSRTTILDITMPRLGSGDVLRIVSSP